MKSNLLAYIFLVILIALLGYVTYIKFTYVEPPKQEVNNEQSNSIALSTIETNYNTLPNITKLKETGITTIATIEENTLKVTYEYTNLDQSINDNNYTNSYVFSFDNGILKNTTAIGENLIELDSLKTIYILLSDAVSIAQGNQSNLSLLTTELVINQNYISDALKVIATDTDITYVIDTTKPITFYQSTVKYVDATITDINEKGYDVEMNNITLNNVSLDYNKTDDFEGYSFKTYITNITDEQTLILKVYDKDKKVLKSQEIKASYNPTTLLFTYNMPLDKKVKKDNVVYYSIEVKESA